MAYGNPEITKEKIKCEECGRWFRKINSPHVERKHNLTIPEYKKRWGFCNTQPLECEEITELRRGYANEFGYNYLKKWKNKNPKKARQNCFKKGIKTWSGREVPEQMRKRLKSIAINVQHTEEFKRKVGDISKKHWQDPKYRKKIVQSMEERYKSSKEKKKTGRAVKKAFDKNPEIKKAISEGNKKYWNSLEGKKKASQRAIKMWKKRKG